MNPMHPENRDQSRDGAGRRLSLTLWLVFATLAGLTVWAAFAKVDESARALGTVIDSNRIQVIQSVDGGVLEKLHVREGDPVKQGQILATFDETRTRAALVQSEAKRAGLQASLARLMGEFASQPPRFAPDLRAFPGILSTQQTLFEGRQKALHAELGSLTEIARLARKELGIVQKLVKTGDAAEIDLVRLERAATDAEAQIANRRNKYIQDVSAEMAKAREELDQVEQERTQRQQQIKNMVLRSPMNGTVKNVRVTTLGGVLKPGDELMQIVPGNDQLIVEAKVLTRDIGRLREGLPATIRFDAFDYAVYGTVDGEVTYISPDSLRDETQRPENPAATYYRVHIKTAKPALVTSIGKRITVIPGMTATVDIKVGERSVLAYLLKPFSRTMTDAFREH